MNIRHTPKPPRLEPGDHLTREEFEYRYEAMPEVKKAELIDGVVYMPSPTRWNDHASPHADLIWALNHYTVFTPGVSVGDSGTVRLDLENEPQPDVAMIVQPESGGGVRIEDGYVAGSPELVAEVSASSVSIDLHRKLDAYQKNGVGEYLVWRVLDQELDWFGLRGNRFVRLDPGPDGLLRSGLFPGLWLDPAALIRRDKPAVLDALMRGVGSPEHAEFVRQLASRRQSL